MVAVWGNIVNIFLNEVIFLTDYMALVCFAVSSQCFMTTYFVAGHLFHRDSSNPSGVAFTSHLIFLPMMFAYEHFISCLYS